MTADHEARCTESASIDLGDNHSAVLRYLDGELMGIAYEHLRPDGTPCLKNSWLPLHADAQYRWDLVSVDPLHIEPSVLCNTCGDHGFIREGRWIGV